MTDRPAAQRLSEAELYSLILELMEIADADVVEARTTLVGDLGLDSLALYQILLTIEALANVEETPQAVPELTTLGECFAYYSEQYRPPCLPRTAGRTAGPRPDGGASC